MTTEQTLVEIAALVKRARTEGIPSDQVVGHLLGLALLVAEEDGRTGDDVLEVLQGHVVEQKHRRKPPFPGRQN